MPCAEKMSTFQFQTGSIKSEVIKSTIRAVLLRFNSKLVRLKGFPKTTLILYCTLTVPVKLIFILIRLGAICCRPLIAQISGRLTALCVERVYRQYFAKFGKNIQHETCQFSEVDSRLSKHILCSHLA